MKVIVTGATGFLGSELCDSLIQKGHEVVGVDLLASPKSSPNYTHVILDLVSDFEAMHQVLSDEKPDVVVNSAALVPISKNRSGFRLVNAILPGKLFDSASKAGVSHFVQISSSAVYTPGPGGRVELSDEKLPMEPYGKSKWAGDRSVLQKSLSSSTKLTIIRPRTVIGQGRGGIMGALFRWIDEGYPLITLGSGDKPFQFVTLTDLVSSICFCLDRGIEGEFNVGSSDVVTLNKVFRHLITRVGSKSRIVRFPDFGLRLLLGIAGGLRLIPLAPYHFKMYSGAFYFVESGLEAHGWNPKSDTLFAFESAFDARAKLDSEEGSAHSAGLQSKLLDKVLKWLS